MSGIQCKKTERQISHFGISAALFFISLFSLNASYPSVRRNRHGTTARAITQSQ